jgi:hypothetical protein
MLQRLDLYVEDGIKKALLGLREWIADFVLTLCEVEERAHWQEQWLRFDAKHNAALPPPELHSSDAVDVVSYL